MNKALASTILRGLYILFGILSIYLSNSIYGLQFYGFYAWGVAAATFGATIALLGINSELIRQYALSNNLPKSPSLNNISLLLFSSTASLAAIIFVIGSMKDNPISFFSSSLCCLLVLNWIKADLFKLQSRILLFEFFKFGIIPVCLMLSLVAAAILDLSFQSMLLIFVLIWVVIWLLISDISLNTDGSTENNVILIRRSYPFVVSAIGSSLFSVLDIIIAGIYFSVEDMAIYAISTRITIIILVPLNYLAAVFQVSLIKGFSNGIPKETVVQIASAKKLYVIMVSLAIILSVVSSNFFESQLNNILLGLSEAMIIFPVFCLMAIVRVICFDKVIVYQFCISSKMFSNVMVVNTLCMVFTVFMVGNDISIVMYACITALYSVIPSIFSASKVFNIKT